MRPKQFVGDEVRERDGGFDARQDAIAKHVSISAKAKKLLRLRKACECMPVVDRPILGFPGPWHNMP